MFQICKKMTLYNRYLDLVNANVYTNFVKILSIVSQDIERKWNGNGITDLRNSGITEGQGKSSIAPTFSKRGYNDASDKISLWSAHWLQR